ncbi:MAG: hypothetical protein EPN43_12505 [Jatrophihabitans sp.]|nr:MAG: hypothetical protein EPN43_12505 [Jatrophihabitans sp.]
MSFIRPPAAGGPQGLALQFPMSLGIFDQYDQAQQAVDYLAEHDFPVENVAIVGTELKTIERVTGRLTRGKIAVAGATSGLWLGLFVGLAFALFSTSRAGLAYVALTPLLGALFGLVWSQIGYAAATRTGRRDFASISQVVATKYEVLVEHRYAERGRELIAGMRLR